MTATITIPCAVPAPTLEQVRAWLTREGWTERCNGFASVWERNEMGTQISHDMRATIVRIAWSIDATPESVYRAIMGPAKAWVVTGHDDGGAHVLSVSVSEDTADRVAREYTSGPENGNGVSTAELTRTLISAASDGHLTRGEAQALKAHARAVEEQARDLKAHARAVEEQARDLGVKCVAAMEHEVQP